MRALILSLYAGLLGLLLSLAACEQESAAGWTEGVYRDYRNLDGCGFLIELEKGNDSVPGRFLEPVNAGSYGVEAAEGVKVRLKYRLLRSASVCMKGQVAEITALRRR
jgi:hypothetical protein